MFLLTMILIIQLNLAVFELPKIKNALFYGNLIMQSYGLWQGLIGGAIQSAVYSVILTIKCNDIKKFQFNDYLFKLKPHSDM